MTLRHFQVIIEWDPDEELWVTQLPALNHLSTYGEPREAALAATKEAILGYIEAAQQEHFELPDSGASVEITEVEIATA